uniref:Uncharacterized protein n=1 Tax=Parascaris univalens TaxID=6257 RepID=A0A915AWV2_PARUN
MGDSEGAAVFRDEYSEDSIEEMRRKLEEAERRNAELTRSLNHAVARSQQMLRIPLNRQPQCHLLMLFNGEALWHYNRQLP